MQNAEAMLLPSLVGAGALPVVPGGAPVPIGEGGRFGTSAAGLRLAYDLTPRMYLASPVRPFRVAP